MPWLSFRNPNPNLHNCDSWKRCLEKVTQNIFGPKMMVKNGDESHGIFEKNHQKTSKYCLGGYFQGTFMTPRKNIGLKNSDGTNFRPRNAAHRSQELKPSFGLKRNCGKKFFLEIMSRLTPQFWIRPIREKKDPSIEKQKSMRGWDMKRLNTKSGWVNKNVKHLQRNSDDLATFWVTSLGNRKGESTPKWDKENRLPLEIWRIDTQNEPCLKTEIQFPNHHFWHIFVKFFGV